MRKSLFYSILTPRGRGAIAVIAVGGPGIAQAVDSCFTPVAGQPLAEIEHAIIYGIWKSTGEDLLVVRTGDDRYEIQCHGSQAVIDAISTDLGSQGATEMQTVDGATDHVDVNFRNEIEQLLNRATTERVALLLLEQWRCFPETVRQLPDLEPVKQQQAIDAMLAHASFGLNFHRTRSIVFCGRPNAGKSSLINRVLGFERAIVNPMPGTTRDVVSAGSAIDGWPVEFNDTAGLRQTDNQIETLGIESAVRMIDQADVIIGVVDAADCDSIRFSPTLSGNPGFPVEPDIEPDIVLINKSDLITPDSLQQTIRLARSAHPHAVCVTTSATTGTGIKALLATISRTLCSETPETGQAYPVTTSQVDWLKALRKLTSPR